MCDAIGEELEFATAEKYKVIQRLPLARDQEGSQSGGRILLDGRFGTASLLHFSDRSQDRGTVNLAMDASATLK